MFACKDSARESKHYQEMATSKPLTRKIPVASCVSFKCFCIGSAPGRQKTRHSEVCNSTSPPDPGKIPQGLSEITRTVTLTLTFCYELLFCPLPVFFYFSFSFYEPVQAQCDANDSCCLVRLTAQPVLARSCTSYVKKVQRSGKACRYNDK